MMCPPKRAGFPGDGLDIFILAKSNIIIYIKQQVFNFRVYPKIFSMKADLEPIRRILAGNIKKYRKNLGYSQEKLAEKADLSAQTLNDIEGCRRWVSALTMTKLAKALHIAEYQLLVPENGETVENPPRSSLKSLISLQHNVINTINIQFDKAKDTGDFT
jgi:transcriptional regulator with XRE-family HTH domain